MKTSMIFSSAPWDTFAFLFPATHTHTHSRDQFGEIRRFTYFYHNLTFGVDFFFFPQLLILVIYPVSVWHRFYARGTPKHAFPHKECSESNKLPRLDILA